MMKDTLDNFLEELALQFNFVCSFRSVSSFFRPFELWIQSFSSFIISIFVVNITSHFQVTTFSIFIHHRHQMFLILKLMLNGISRFYVWLLHFVMHCKIEYDNHYRPGHFNIMFLDKIPFQAPNMIWLKYYICWKNNFSFCSLSLRSLL